MDRQKSAEVVRAGITARQRAEPVVEARDELSVGPEQMPRKRALKPEVADGIREIRLGAQWRQATTSTKCGTAGTAVYGTVRTVVWEDGGLAAPSYPIPSATGMQKEVTRRFPFVRLSPTILPPASGRNASLPATGHRLAGRGQGHLAEVIP